VGAALLCAAWLQLRVHSGVGHRLTGATHLRGRAAEQELVVMLFVLAAVGILAARHTVARAFLRLASRSELRPVDPLAAASFTAYRTNSGVKSFTSPDGRACIAYRRAGPMVVALGGPTGEDWAAARLQRRFLETVRRPIAWYGTSQAHDLCSIRIGQEAIVRPGTFSTEGSKMANLRHTVSRARRAGVSVAIGRWPDLAAGSRAGVEEMEREWARHHRLKFGFSLSSLDEATCGQRLFAVASREGRVEAAVSWLEAGSGGGRVLDLIRRRQDAEPGCIELLLRDSIETFARQGVEWTSLGLAGHAGLRRYKQKFQPEWHDRYLAFPLLAAPMALLAVAWVHLFKEHARRGA
jgi:phosphatidylglycerol lysyltransferase